ncbi:hypothetical protein ACFX14_006323 [Malus domestica]
MMVTVEAAARALERVLRGVEEGLGFWERGEGEFEDRWHLTTGRRLLEAVAAVRGGARVREEEGRMVGLGLR